MPSHVKYCAYFRVAPALIARKCVQAHTNVERRHVTRLTISGAEAQNCALRGCTPANVYVTRRSVELFGRPLAALTEYAATSDRRKTPSIGLLRAQTLFFSRDTSTSKGAAVRT